MFEKYTEGSIKVVMVAQEESRRLWLGYVGSEQLMLGLIGQRRGIAGSVLYQQGVRAQTYRQEVEKHVGRGTTIMPVQDIPFTPRAKTILELAVKESQSLQQNYVGAEHILLAMITEGSGLGIQLLKRLNINVEETKRLVYDAMGKYTEYKYYPWKRALDKKKKDQETRYKEKWRKVLSPAAFEVYKQRKERYNPFYRLVEPSDSDIDLDSQKNQYSYFSPEQAKLRYLFAKDPQRGTRASWDESEEYKSSGYKDPIEYLPEELQERARQNKKKEEIAIARARGREVPDNDLGKLLQYGDDLTSRAFNKKLDPVIGRDDVITELIKVLARRRKNNPVLVGEPGVGKTACAEGLALVMVDVNKCPEFLEGYQVFSLDIGSVIAGTKYRGEFEERFKNIIEDAQRRGDIILVIDEIHTICGAGAAEGSVDAANLLKPALARGLLKVIGATTIAEYRKHIEKDTALERRFHPITVSEPTVKTTIDILKGLRPYYQQHHALIYEDEGLEAAASLSSRFITDRQLPDKAIDVIDEAGSQVRLRNRELPPGLQKLLAELHETLKDIETAIQTHDFNLAKLLIEHELEVRAHMKVLKGALAKQNKFVDELKQFDRVGEKEIANVISGWTGIPVTKINESETERLKMMENILHDRLIGQHHAVTAVSKAVRRARTGIQDPKRPIASFIFAGPTGVGKTELTKALAEYIFDSEKNMIRFDMSEFMEKHTAAKLVGSPPGYIGHDEGGQLTDAVRRKPYSIVLFDEVEKAHPDIFNLFLQILDDGQLTDSKGALTDFKNCIIVMTTNLGAKVIEQESPILPGKRNKSFGFDVDNWEKDQRGNQKIELMVNLDGTFTVKPPVKQVITEEDEGRFTKINELVNEELKKFFRPEFLNRVDDIIVFQHLSKHDIWEISGIMLKNLSKRLELQGVTVEIDNAVRFFLTEQGYDPVYGARPLRRAIIKLLEDELAVACLNNPLEKGTHIIIKQELNPNHVTYAEYFDDIYSDKIVITFDKTNVQKELKNDTEDKPIEDLVVPSETSIFE